MSGDALARQAIAKGRNSAGGPAITAGVVVDTDDPQQNGRVRVACGLWGDETNSAILNVQNIPWATIAPQLSGVMTQGFRGVSSPVEDDTPYGFFGVPKVGTEVIVAKLNDDPKFRVVIGVLPPLGSMGAMPHGRFQTSGSYPDGPLSMSGKPIEPLYSNLTETFGGVYGNGPRGSFEWMSRGADYSATAHRDASRNKRQTDNDPENVTVSEADGKSFTYTAGYASDRVGDQPSVVSDSTRKYDPQTYCWGSPGFHSISMDDRAENCRIKLRTTTGHQIIMDDTNERIYVSTHKGKNWIEMDTCGNIDIHSDMRVSLHAAKDINLTSEETIRLSSKNIHLRAQNEMRMYSNKDMHLYSSANLRVRTTEKTLIQTGNTFEVLATADAKITSSANVHVLASSAAHVTGNGSVHILSSGNILETGAQIYMNSGSAASPADSATASQSKTAYHSNRIPMHEPWPRVLTDTAKSDQDASVTAIPVVYTSGSLSDFEYKSYTDVNIGRVEYGVSLARNAKWHR